MKKTTKLLSIVLTLIMCLGILPMTVFAATEVNSVSILNVVKPVAGKTADFTWSIPSGEGYAKASSSGVNCAWIETNSESTTYEQLNRGTPYTFVTDSLTFKADKYYTFVANVKASAGCSFSGELTAKINYHTANVDSGANRTEKIWYCFGKPTKQITQVEALNVTPPVAGATSNFDWNIPDGANYKVSPLFANKAVWVETDTYPTTKEQIYAGNWHWNTDDDFIFQYNKYYTFLAIALPDSGYIFSDNPSATMNGNTASTMLWGEENNDCHIFIYYCFGKPAEGVKVLSSLTLVTPPPKTVYYENEYFLKVAINLSANYTDGSSKTITSYSVTPSQLHIGDTQVTIIYTEGGITKSLVIPVTVMETTKINSVDITDMVPPVVGETASFNYKLASDLYFIDDVSFEWIETDTAPTIWDELSAGKKYDSDDNLVFKADKYYSINAYILPINERYNFSESAPVTINGEEVVEADGDSTGIQIWYCFGQPTESVLSSISVTTQPTKKIYITGESFDKSGMVVKANYSNGTSKTITNYTVTNGNVLTLSRTSVTISYTEDGITKTIDVPITVNEEPTLTSLKITTPPIKTVYYAGEVFQKEGMVVTAYYDDGTSAPSDYYIEDYIIHEGQTFITVGRYNKGIEYTAKQPITVKPTTKISAVEFTGVVTPVIGAVPSYAVNIPNDAVYENYGYGVWIETDTIPTDFEALESGKQIYFEDNYSFKADKYYTFVVSVYIDNLDYAFSNSVSAKINGKAATSVADETSLSSFYCFGKAKSSATLTGIEISSRPTTTDYQYKSSVSKDGLVVTAVYSDGSRLDVSNQVTIKDFDTTKDGNRTATVEFEGKTATFNYTVKFAWWQMIIRILLLGFLWY